MTVQFQESLNESTYLRNRTAIDILGRFNLKGRVRGVFAGGARESPQKELRKPECLRNEQVTQMGDPQKQ